jgi:hypothetical protein
MKNYTEDALQRALCAVNEGMSLRKASQLWGIPLMTLSDRNRGSKPRRVIAASQQRLTMKQEKELVGWILIQDSIGTPPTHKQVAMIAATLLPSANPPHKLGRHWIEGFVKRHPEVRTLRGKRIDLLRANGATSDQVKAFFLFLKNPTIRDIPASRRYNMDEGGILEGVGINGLVLGSSRKRYTLHKQTGSRELITAVETISATGEALPPLIIFKGKWVQKQWFPKDLEPFKEWFFTASENGWTSDEIALAWLQSIFIPLTKPASKKQKRLLILDGHGSHTTAQFMIQCYHNNIHLLFLPSHSSHVLQPLDISVFSPVKAAYRDELAESDVLIDSSPISKMTFLECYSKARLVGLTAYNIRAGWRGSGLWPVNEVKLLMSPYVMKPVFGPFRLPSTPPTTPTKAGIKRKDDHDHEISTPRGSHQVRAAIRDFLDDKAIDPTMRLLFRKICKGLDEQQVKISLNTKRIRHLEVQNERLRPRKRTRLAPDPNTKFANVVQLAEQADRFAAIPDHIDEPEQIENYIFEELCFQWQLD